MFAVRPIRVQDFIFKMSSESPECEGMKTNTKYILHILKKVQQKS